MARGVNYLLREQVAVRASYRCEYCLLHEADSGYRHQVDHILSRKHDGDSKLPNLAFACVVCNRLKGSDVASIDIATGQAIRLFHPRRDRWIDHFRLTDNRIEPLTDEGKATARLLQFNMEDRIAERAVLGRRIRPDESL